MSSPKAVTHTLVERKVGDLWVDPNVQRSLRKARVTAMANEFEPSALGVLTTSYRGAGRIHIIDGQHRYRAAEAAAYTGIIQTMEYRGLSIPEEAALFRLLNTAEKPSRIDHFLVSCVEQDPASLRLAGFLADNGWSIGVSGSEARLSAIGSLQRVYALSPDAASATLGVLTAAYGHRAAAVQGSLVEGVGRVLAKYGSAVDLADLIKRLAKVPGGPDGLVGNARGQSFTRTGNLSAQVARVVVGLYNQRRRTNALAEWQ